MGDMSTRDNLIADWRARLADAEAEPMSAAPPRAWLTRVRVRLYRFLLSLYGTGEWRADGEQSLESQPAASAAVVFDSAEAETLTGKPAKGEGQIRTVLKAVANSQDHRPQAGSLQGSEVIANLWLMVVSDSTNLSLPRCQNLLKHHGIECRRVAYGREWALEVRAATHPAAVALLDKHYDDLRKPPRVAPAGPSPRTVHSQLMGMYLLLVLPLICVLLFGLFSNVGRGIPPTSDEWLVYGVSLLITAIVSCFAIGCSWWCQRVAAQRSNP
jgi:hypothetical protein